MSEFAVMPISDYVRVCDRVREKTGDTEAIKSGEMADKIIAVYEKGQRNALIDMWEALQMHGKRTNYSSLIQNIEWTPTIFKPIYDINVSSAYNFGDIPLITSYIDTLRKEGQISIKELEEERGISFTFVGSNFTKGCIHPLIREYNVVDLSKATTTHYAFYGGYLSTSNAKDLMPTRIERLICSETTVFHNTTFQYAEGYTYIGFEGVIAQSINLQYSPLTAESIKSCINTLSDGTTDKTVTFNLNAVNTAFETGEGLSDGSESQEWLNLIATKENWTFSLV